MGISKGRAKWNTNVALLRGELAGVDLDTSREDEKVFMMVEKVGTPGTSQVNNGTQANINPPLYRSTRKTQPSSTRGGRGRAKRIPFIDTSKLLTS